MKQLPCSLEKKWLKFLKRRDKPLCNATTLILKMVLRFSCGIPGRFNEIEMHVFMPFTTVLITAHLRLERGGEQVICAGRTKVVISQLIYNIAGHMIRQKINNSQTCLMI